MRKHFANLLIIAVLALLLVGCTGQTAEPTMVPTQTVTPTETATPTKLPVTAPTEASIQVPATTENTIRVTDATIPEETPAATETEATGKTLPYLQRIKQYDHPIYEGPGYDYMMVATVQTPGIYTIVEEVLDWEGILWGRLKSGIGWVDLTEIQSADYESALLSANYAQEYLLLHGAYHHCPSEDEYSVSVAFRAYGTLRDVTLFAFEYDAEGLYPGTDFFTLEEMTEDMPLVAELAFPGDMTTYGIRFVDETGVTHIYSIYISGRNGSLILTEE